MGHAAGTDRVFAAVAGQFWTRAPQSGQARRFIALFSHSRTCCRGPARERSDGNLRVDAAVGADHELVRSGPYRLVRHPIYTSMLCVILATGVLTVAARLYCALSIRRVPSSAPRSACAWRTGFSRRASANAFRAIIGEPPARYIPFLWSLYGY